MNLERIEEIYADFKDALVRLKEAGNEDLGKGNIVVDGTIQRFEFTFELGWKLLRAVLDYNGIETDTPRMVIKEAFKSKILRDGDGWIDMLEDRNKTSHIYDEKRALEIYNKIKKSHIKLLEDIKNTFPNFVPVQRTV